MEKENFFKESRQNIKAYVQDNLLLLKLQVVEKTSRLIALIASALLIVVLCFFIILFLSVLAAYYFSDLTGSVYTGFGIVGGFYVVALVVIILLKKKIVDRLITNTVINIFFESGKETKHDE